ncbi:MAG TPA: hypothetical protein VJ691_17335 [Vicinamibacterales bacterium]|nr:hypothetical protein [Vicinamibacterales bacterium]
MKTLLTVTGLTVALFTGAGMSSSAVQDQDHKKFEKGSTVTLQGCVVEAEKKGTFVMNNVREWPLAATDMGKHGKRMYWIEKTDKLKSHVGHTIQVTGKITEVAKSEMEFKDGGFKVEIEGPGRDVVTPAANAGVSRENRPNMNDIPITLLKLQIDNVKMVSGNCNSTL